MIWILQRLVIMVTINTVDTIENISHIRKKNQYLTGKIIIILLTRNYFIMNQWQYLEKYLKKMTISFFNFIFWVLVKWKIGILEKNLYGISYTE